MSSKTSRTAKAAAKSVAKKSAPKAAAKSAPSKTAAKSAPKAATEPVVTAERVAKLTPKAASNVNETIKSGLKTGQKPVDAPDKAAKASKAAKPAKATKEPRTSSFDYSQKAVTTSAEARDGSFYAIVQRHAKKPVALSTLIDNVVSDKELIKARRANNDADKLRRDMTVRIRDAFKDGTYIKAA